MAAQAIQAFLKQNLNLEIQLEGLQGQAFREKMYAHEIQLNYVRWYMDYPDPNNNFVFDWYSSRASGSRHEYADPEFDKIVVEAAAEGDWDKRLALYAEAGAAVAGGGRGHLCLLYLSPARLQALG